MFEEKVAVITGASGGIGKAITESLAREKATVILTYKNNKESAENIRNEIIESGGKASIYQADVSEEQDVKRLFSAIKKEFGKIDILINNSGITKDGFLPIMSSKKFDEVIQVNLKGTYLCCREAVKQMILKKQGTIINIASTSGISGAIGQTNYSASKGGIIAFTKSLALEVAQYNIRANVVAPGFIETQMTKKMDQKTLNKMLELIPLKRLGRPEEVANLVTFLASQLSEYITGKVFIIDGGLING
ncbi:3-oxoacyl-[acyl-carrier-protein] reductase [Bacillus safensis]|nr:MULTISPECIES: 3-oxoacyl-[acyl-carrier-protein] reductase [Bacillus]MCY7466006.1 3-oxoacyl-[acyl-carrier-protein] reductase [Bacillus safensis]MDH6561662.1 3-oxoacyl-[acyl-carrier protein] reductase [Bacillus sp. TBS-096]MDP4565341.1 3-oxoacyl-[acyl-carrier-protein] reductase [Bacillus safensis]MEC0922716.1 3-oxoacyl-[acyl-carrier-protein] reductase [Bacillus safensis]MEC0995797.1 3-oxoacyl-[acyl-carrier-protein] reductase [Bacillus safensis]